MEFNVETQKKLTRWVLTIATCCILIYLGIKNVGTIAGAAKWVLDLFMPLSLGVFFALILDVPVRFFETHLCKSAKKERTKKIMRPLAMILSIIMILGIFVGIFGLVIPELIEAVKIIVDGIIEVVNSLNNAEMPKIFEKIPVGETIYNNIITAIDFSAIGTTLTNWLKEQSGTIMNTAVGTVSSVVSLFANLIIAIIFAIYVLVNKAKLKKQIVRLVNAWVPKKIGSWCLHATSVGLSIFRSFVSATVGALVGVTAFIPVVGALVGTVVGAFMILTVDPGKALIFVIYLLILQQIEGNIIYPKVMGGKVNLPAMWVLAAVTIGGGIAGPFGMLLGVPVTSTIYVLAKEATENRERRIAEKEKQEQKTEDKEVQTEINEE